MLLMSSTRAPAKKSLPVSTTLDLPFGSSMLVFSFFVQEAARRDPQPNSRETILFFVNMIAVLLLENVCPDRCAQNAGGRRLELRRVAHRIPQTVGAEFRIGQVIGLGPPHEQIPADETDVQPLQ